MRYLGQTCAFLTLNISRTYLRIKNAISAILRLLILRFHLEVFILTKNLEDERRPRPNRHLAASEEFLPTWWSPWWPWPALPRPPCPDPPSVVAGQLFVIRHGHNRALLGWRFGFMPSRGLIKKRKLRQMAFVTTPVWCSRSQIIACFVTEIEKKT